MNKRQRKKNMRRREWTRSQSTLDKLIAEHSARELAVLFLHGKPTGLLIARLLGI
jgi:hypothetical protein